MAARRKVEQATYEFEDEWYYLYARISSDDKKRKTRDGHSRQAEGVESQMRRMHRECDRRGVPMDRRVEFVDNDISASRFGKKEREDYARLVERIGRSFRCTVMAAEQSRLVRQELEGIQFKELCLSHRMNLGLLTGDRDLSSDAGDIAWTIELFFSRRESEKISTRTRGKLEDQRNEGRMHTSRIPFGYADTAYGEIIQDQADMLQTLRKHIMLPESTIGECVRMLESAGYVSPYPRKDGSQGPYTRQAVMHMLKNAAYAGYVTYEGEAVRRSTNIKPIFTDAQFTALQERLAEIANRSISRRKQPLRVGRRYVETGFLVCGKDGCGGSMQINYGHSLGWQCSVCFGSGRKFTTVREAINTWMYGRLSVAAVDARSEMMADPQVVRLEAELAELEARRARLAAAYANPAVPLADEDYFPMIADLRDEITTRQGLLARMVRDAEQALPPDALALWEDDRPETLGARRALLATLVDRVIILPAPPPPNGRKTWGRKGAPPSSVRVVPRVGVAAAEAATELPQTSGVSAA